MQNIADSEISKMADKRETQRLERKRKHTRNLHFKDAKGKKTVKSSKRNPKVENPHTIQPQLPKTATEMSSNWKLLQAVSFQTREGLKPDSETASVIF